MKNKKILLFLFISFAINIVCSGEENVDLVDCIALKNYNQLYITTPNHFNYAVSVENPKGKEIAEAYFIITNNSSSGKVVCLSFIKVDQSYRNNKIGSDIINSVIAFAKANDDAEEMNLISVDSAQKFYEKLGFVFSGTCGHRHGEKIL